MQPRINLNISTCNQKITPWKFEVHLLFHVSIAVLQSSPLSPLLQAAININELLEKDTQVFRPKGAERHYESVHQMFAGWSVEWVKRAGKPWNGHGTAVRSWWTRLQMWFFPATWQGMYINLSSTGIEADDCSLQLCSWPKALVPKPPRIISS